MTKKSIPVEFKTTGNPLIKMKKLQNKMMDNGEIVKATKVKKTILSIRTYPDTKFQAFKQVIADSTIICQL